VNIEVLIQEANPFPGEAEQGLDQEAQNIYDRVVTSSMSSIGPRRLIHNKWVLTGGVLSVVTAAAAVLLVFVFPGSPVGPPSAAAAVLNQAAMSAAAEPPVTIGPGQYLYSETRGTSQSDALSQTAAGQIDVIFTETSQIWAAADGLGRGVTTYDGPGQFATSTSQQNWISAGSPAAVLSTPAGPDGGTLETTYGPGCSGSGSCYQAPGQPESGRKPLDVSSLPTDPADLLRVIEAGKTGDDNLDVSPTATGSELALDVFGSAADLLAQPEVGVTPAFRSALYQVMANVSGIQLLGNVTDHSGQSGTGIAGPTYMGLRDQLVIDPTTGELLEQERVIVDPSAEPPGLQKYAGTMAGQVTSWTDYLSSGVVGSVTALPGGQ
jgi:hypothetical protein